MTSAIRSTLSLTDLLAHCARAHPDRPALTDGVRSFDYRTLDTVADRVAGRLRELGVGRNDRVALLGTRDARVCALLHGVLRAGAAAVLVDPEWSGPELRRRLDAVEVRCALSTDPAFRAPGACRTEVLDLDTPAERGPVVFVGPEPDLAYLSFTSGSGGEPKAVGVTHANAVHYARSLCRRLGLTEADAPRIAHVTTLAADLGHTAWLLALATAGFTGTTVYELVDGEDPAPRLAADLAALGKAGWEIA